MPVLSHNYCSFFIYFGKCMVLDTLNNRLSGLSLYFPTLDPQPKSSLVLTKKGSLVTFVLSFMNEFEISNEMSLFCACLNIMS